MWTPTLQKQSEKISLNDRFKLQTFTVVVEEAIRFWQFEEYCNLTDWLTDRLAAFLDNDYYKMLMQPIANINANTKYQ